MNGNYEIFGNPVKKILEWWIPAPIGLIAALSYSSCSANARYDFAGLDYEGLDIDGRMCGQLTELKLQNSSPAISVNPKDRAYNLFLYCSNTVPL